MEALPDCQKVSPVQMKPSTSPRSKRSSKEWFRKQRGRLFKIARAMMQVDAEILIIVRRSDVSYVYNSEEFQEWLPIEGDKVSFHLNWELGINGFRSNTYISKDQSSRLRITIKASTVTRFLAEPSTTIFYGSTIALATS